MQEERRQEKRVSMYNAVRVVCLGSETFGFIHNLSKIGIGLFCERQYQEGENIKIHLGLPDDVVTLSGRVVWRRESIDKDKGQFMYGIELESQPEGFLQFLSQIGADSI